MIFKKCEQSGGDLQKFLLDYRNTPLPDLNASPAQLLQSRRLRTSFVFNDNLLKPELQDISDQLVEIRSQRKNYHDKHAVESK